MLLLITKRKFYIGSQAIASDLIFSDLERLNTKLYSTLTYCPYLIHHFVTKFSITILLVGVVFYYLRVALFMLYIQHEMKTLEMYFVTKK